ncbi:hypothetical protein ALT716_220008 [Alteromonas macleodii]
MFGLIDIKCKPTKQKTITELKNYCKFDTLATVKLYEYVTST